MLPEEVERTVMGHPAVREAAVVGVPAGLGGEQVWAFVVPEAGAAVTSHQVREYCRGRLESYQIP